MKAGALYHNTATSAGACTWTADTTGNAATVTLPPTITINAITAPYYYSASAQATTVGVGGISSGSTSGPVTSCIDFGANEGLFIAGAGAAAADFIGTIVSCVGTTLTWTGATSTTVIAGAVVKHDDTASVQAAITAVAGIGGKILFPTGRVWINGPALNTSGSNAAVILPSVALNGSFEGATLVTILVEGIVPPSDPYVSSGASQVGTIWERQESGFIIGGSNGNTTGFTAIDFRVKDLTLRNQNNPIGSGLNCGYVSECYVEDALTDVDVSNRFSTAQPTTATAVGIIMPLINNQNQSYLRNVVVTGYYKGIEHSEHLVGDNVTISMCVQGLVPLASNHPSYISRLASWWNNYDIYPTGASSYLDIGELAIEASNGSLAPAWTGHADSIYDPNNYLFGGTVYQEIQSGTAAPAAWVANGGGNFRTSELATQNMEGFSGLQNWAFSNFYYGVNSYPVTVNNGVVTITPPVSSIDSAALENLSAPDFTGHTWTARVTSVLGGTAGQTQLWMSRGLTTSNFIVMYQANGTLTFSNGASVVSTATYNGTTQLWWRLREASGTIYGEVSANGISWSMPSGFSVAPGWSYTSGTHVGVGTYVASTYSGTASFDNLSYLGPPSVFNGDLNGTAAMAMAPASPPWGLGVGGTNATTQAAAFASIGIPLALGAVNWNNAGSCTFAAASAPIAAGTVTTVSGQSCTLIPTGLVTWGSYTLEIVNASSTAATFTLGTAGASCSAWKVGGGSSGAVILSGASAIDVLAFTFDGTNCVANFRANFN
jgi:hypothetical protein